MPQKNEPEWKFCFTDQFFGRRAKTGFEVNSIKKLIEDTKKNDNVKGKNLADCSYLRHVVNNYNIVNNFLE